MNRKCRLSWITPVSTSKGRCKGMGEKVRIAAVLEVDKEKLAESGVSFEDKMGWAEQPGIRMVGYQEQRGEYEYASFLWSRRRGRYEQVNRAVQTEQLCRNRLQEYISKGWLNEDYDTSKVLFKKRLVSILCTEWKEVQGGQG